MTAQFHEGQEVEVWGANMYPWRKAKIVAAEIHRGALGVPTGAYIVQFPDGTRGVFDAEHIRAVTKFIEVPGTCRQQHDEYQE